MKSSRIIYGSVISPFVRKVLIVLNLKHITYEVQSLIPFINDHKQQILQMNPLGQIPIYQDGNFTISDSSVICAYLEKKYPNNSIYPKMAENYARCLWYEEYADTQLIPAIRTVFFNTLLATKFNREPDMKAVKDTLENRLPKIFDYLDKEIGDKEFLIEGCFSLADISVVTAFINFEFAGHKVDTTRWGNLSRYMDGISKEKFVEEAFLQSKEKFAS